MSQRGCTERGIVVVITRQPASSEGWINGHKNPGKLCLGRVLFAEGNHIDARRRSKKEFFRCSQGIPL
ncbi:hypothetical protein PR048_007942 [Dryococelus australis]|uniref:Uncharacterized protein n=1 Tax=Dryococelus australis TaxID=614101 RepID=A0ABQ9HVN6_9NEOP|nr:hypothetical protein PR048_007942 [Dryococelus australis]